MEWRDVGLAVAKAAPILGGVLGGPFGAAAGAAGSLLASFLGEEPDPDRIMERIRDPEVLLRIRELESRERERLLEWRTKQMEFDLDNVRSAREREVAMARAGHGGAWATGVVSLVVVAGFFAVLWSVLDAHVVNEPALLLLGSLGTGFGAVVNYYLGSSLGSRQKSAALGPLAESSRGRAWLNPDTGRWMDPAGEGR